MKLNKLSISVLSALVLAAPFASAVTVSDKGTGQVLLYPYYTVNGGNSTLFTVTNTTDLAKALKVRFREAHNQREVLDFNVYISPRDVWTANIAADDATGPAKISTSDKTCTVPTVPPTAATAQPFLDSAYNGDIDGPGLSKDAGPQNLARTREGTIEVIEMGTLIPESLSAKAVGFIGGAPKNCGVLDDEWSGGVWTTQPTKDLANPTGGLSGSVSVVNAAAATVTTYNAIALEEFRQDPTDIPRGTKNSVVMHTIADPTPDLSSALTDPARHLASVSVMADGKMIRADYPAATQAVDAVTAALMDERIGVGYQKLDTVASEWVLNFPTRAFYTDESIVGKKAIAPFSAVFPLDGGKESSACTEISYNIYDRETKSGSAAHASELQSCNAMQTIPLNQSAKLSPMDASLLHSSMATRLEGANPVDAGFEAGWMDIDFVSSVASSSAGAMRPANDGTVFRGLPAIGFVTVKDGSTTQQNGTAACKKHGGNCD